MCAWSASASTSASRAGLSSASNSPRSVMYRPNPSRGRLHPPAVTGLRGIGVREQQRDVEIPEVAESRAGIVAVHARDHSLESARILGECLPVCPPLGVVHPDRFHEQERVLAEEPAQPDPQVDRRSRIPEPRRSIAVDHRARARQLRTRGGRRPAGVPRPRCRESARGASQPPCDGFVTVFRFATVFRTLPSQTDLKQPVESRPDLQMRNSS